MPLVDGGATILSSFCDVDGFMIAAGTLQVTQGISVGEEEVLKHSPRPP